MKARKFTLTLFVVLLFLILNYCFSQDLLTVKTLVKIKENAGVFIKGAVKGEGAGKITNNGILKLTDNWTNNVSSSFLSGTGEIVFNSSTATQIIGGSATTTYNKLTVNNSSASVLMAQNISVSNLLSMTNGQLDLNNATLVLGPSADIVNETNTNRIKVGNITSNTGTIQTTRTLNNVTNFNPGNLGVSITTNSNLGEITIVRGHQVQSGIGNFSENKSIARYIELRNLSDEFIDFKLDASNIISMNYWDAELNAHTELELVQYQWIKEGSGE